MVAYLRGCVGSRHEFGNSLWSDIVKIVNLADIKKVLSFVLKQSFKYLPETVTLRKYVLVRSFITAIFSSKASAALVEPY